MKYSGTFEFLLFAIWAIGSLLLAWFIPRRIFAYFTSVALSMPMIGYSMLGYGMLEGGGIIHAFCAGLYILPFHYFFQRYRIRKMQRPDIL